MRHVHEKRTGEINMHLQDGKEDITLHRYWRGYMEAHEMAVEWLLQPIQEKLDNDV